MSNEPPMPPVPDDVQSSADAERAAYLGRRHRVVRRVRRRVGSDQDSFLEDFKVERRDGVHGKSSKAAKSPTKSHKES